MNAILRGASTALLLGGLACGQGLHPPVALQAGGKRINVEVGHAAPYLFDWNGDGRQDLLVGQFGGGKLRIYLDKAQQGEPRYDGFHYFAVDGAEASVPYG